MAVSENILTNLRLPARADARMVNSTSSQVKYYRAVFFKAFVRRRTMNARIILLSLAIIGLALSRCEKRIDATEENGLAREITNDLIPITVVNPDSFAAHYDSLPKDTVTILSGEIRDDTLKLTVEYPGGCGEHTFSLLTSTGIAKSNPPQFTAYLGHDADNDSRQAKIRISLLFDLKSVRASFQQVWLGEDKWPVLVIRVYGYDVDWRDKSMWWNY